MLPRERRLGTSLCCGLALGLLSSCAPTESREGRSPSQSQPVPRLESAPAPGSEAGDRRMVGLVELPGLLGRSNPDGPPGQVRPSSPQAIPVFKAPDVSAGLLRMVSSGDDVESREHGYEEVSAVVYGTAEGWYEIGLGNEGRATGWIGPDVAGRFRSVESLLAESSYVTEAWNRLLYEAASTTSGYTTVGETSHDSQDGSASELIDGTPPNEIQVLEARREGEQVWLRVNLLRGRCRSEPPVIVGRGWIPLHGPRGLNAWFYSRGC